MPSRHLAQLAFLAGTWRNDWYEATYTTPRGGMVLSVSKEFRLTGVEGGKSRDLLLSLTRAD